MSKRHIGGSILPSSDPRILQPMRGLYGVLRVVAVPEIDEHVLLLQRPEFDRPTTLASHANGYSCHNLACRILEAWEGRMPTVYALDQLDYILRCGGMGVSPPTLQSIVDHRPEPTTKESP